MSYKLHKAICINFGNMVKREFYFKGDLTLLIGATGSGKSTFEDMVQSVMTGDTYNIVNYNAGQSEDSTKKKGQTQRSFASYLLGADQLKFTRNEAIGIVALVLKNKNGSIFTAWMYGEAEVEGSKEKSIAKGGVEALGICYDVELKASEFMVDEDPESGIKELSALKKYLKTMYKNQTHFCDGKKDYLVKLYSTLNGVIAIPYRDAEKAAKAFVKYIYPTKADNINKFIKTELLDENDLSKVVSSLQEAIKSFSRIQKEADAINKSEKSLKIVLSVGENVLTEWKNHFSEKFKSTKREQIRLIEEKDDCEHEHYILFEHLKSKIRTIEDSKLNIPEYQDESRLLSLSLEGNPKIIEKNNLESQLLNLSSQLELDQKKLTNALKTFSEAFTYINSANQIRPIDEFIDIDILEMLEKMNTISIQDINKKSLDYKQVIKGIDSLLIDNGDYLSALGNDESNAINAFNTLKDEIKDIEEQINTFSLTGKQSYPNQRDINVIREYYPNSNPIPLCELIEITDSNWQRAIEGFLAWNRFAIVVSEEFEVEVTDFLKEKKLKSKIIQGQKVLNDMNKLTREVRSDSIVSLMNFNSPIAEAYIKLNYGNVLQYNSTHKLIKASRGLKIDGLAASGYTTFNCIEKASSCYIGESARLERYTYLKTIIDSKIKELNILEAQKNKITETRNKLTRLTFSDTQLLSEIIHNRQVEINFIENKIKSLDITEEESKLDRIKFLKAKVDALIKQKDEALEEKGKTEDQIKNKENLIINFKKSLDEIDNKLKDLGNVLKIVLSDDTKPQNTYINNLILDAKQTYKDKTQPPIYEKVVKELIHDYDYISNDHNINCVEIAKVNEASYYRELTDTVESYKRLYFYYQSQKTIYQKLTENVLKNKVEELTNAKDEFNNSFKDEFCHRVYNSVIEGKEKIKRLNYMLKKHRFGNEKFTIKDPFSKVYEDYYDYFEYIVMSKKDSMGYDKDSLPEELIETKNDIEKLLLEGSDTESSKKLKSISDYRNYKEYDIHKVFNNDEEHSVSLNRLATDSGGQATTSYYIIRSIAAYSAFDKENKRYKSGGLGFLMIDEAFNRVDDQRPGDIIKYLKDALGFQLIAAMPPQNESVFIPYASDRYEVYKTIEDESYENYKVKQFSDYTELNTSEISSLLNNEENNIRNQQSLLDF